MFRRFRWLIWLSVIASLHATADILNAQPAGVDALGDPLPDGARLRFGTMRFKPPSGVSELALSPDDKTVVTVGDHIIIWNAETGQELWRGEVDPHGRSFQGSRYGARPLVFSDDATKFFTTEGPNQISVCNLQTQSHESVSLQADALPSGRHEKGVLALDVTKDGTRFAVGRSSSLIVCDAEGEVVYEIENLDEKKDEENGDDRLAFFGPYSYGRFSPDGKVLAVVVSETPKEIRLFDAPTGEELRTIPLTDKLVRLEFSLDSSRIVTTERDSAVRMYDVKTTAEIWSHIVELHNPFENYTSAVAYSPDGTHVAAGATDHHIYLLDAANGHEVGRLKGTHWYPWTLAFTKDGQRIFSAGWDGTIRRWDVTTRKQLPLPQGVHGSEVIAASPDGITLAYQDDAGVIRIAQVADGREMRQISQPGFWATQLRFSPDGQTLAAGGENGDQVQVILWTIATGNRQQDWSWPKGRDPHSKVEALSFTPDGSRLAAAVFRQSSAYLWNLETGEQIAQLPHRMIYGLSFSPDNETLATAGWDSKLRFWDSETGKLRQELEVKNKIAAANDVRMYAVCYAPEGNLFATAHMDHHVRIWQADTLDLLRSINVQASFSYGALSFSPDGLWLATGSGSGSVKVWDPSTGQLVWDRGEHHDNVYTVGFGRNSGTMVSGADNGMGYLWDLHPVEKLTNRSEEALWNAISGENSLAAYRAIWSLIDDPDHAVVFLKRRIEPILRETSDEEVMIVRRVLAVLSQIGTAQAKTVLEEMKDIPASNEIPPLIQGALNRIQPALVK